MGRREEYRYPPAKLIRSEENPEFVISKNFKITAVLPRQCEWDNPGDREKYSSRELDEYHTSLLNSEKERDLVLGALSVRFWSEAGSRDGLVYKEKAKKSTEVFIQNNLHKKQLAKAILHARSLIESKKFGDALIALLEIPETSIITASRIAALIDPHKAAEYDDSVAHRSKNTADERSWDLDIDEHSMPAKEIAKRYQRWCRLCASRTEDSTWKDWNGKTHEYRAIDVGRSFISYGALEYFNDSGSMIRRSSRKGY